MRVSSETWYVAEDGSRHTTEASAVARDALLIKCEAIHDLIGPRAVDNVCRFANGGGYVQHDPVGLARARVALEALTIEEVPSVKEWRALRGGGSHPSMWGRALDGSCPPVESLWHRLWCIDAKGREWGQPYYASHPDEGTEIAWEHTTTKAAPHA